MQECLRDQTTAGQAVSWDCQEELFRQVMESADDIRLSHRLYAVCMADKKKFCADVKPGKELFKSTWRGEEARVVVVRKKRG